MAHEIHHLDLQPPVVIESGLPLRRAWFEEIAREDHRVAIRLGAFGPGHTVGDRHARAARRPRQEVARRGERVVRGEDAPERQGGGAVEPLHYQARLVVNPAGEGQRLAVWRPAHVRARVAFPAEARRCPGRAVPDPDLRRRPAGPAVRLHGVGDALAVGRDAHLAHGLDLEQVGAGPLLLLLRQSRRPGDSRHRQRHRQPEGGVSARQPPHTRSSGEGTTTEYRRQKTEDSAPAATLTAPIPAGQAAGRDCLAEAPPVELPAEMRAKAGESRTPASRARRVLCSPRSPDLGAPRGCGPEPSDGVAAWTQQDDDIVGPWFGRVLPSAWPRR